MGCTQPIRLQLPPLPTYSIQLPIHLWLRRLTSCLWMMNPRIYF
jgi:hypothetical protein